MTVQTRALKQHVSACELHIYGRLAPVQSAWKQWRWRSGSVPKHDPPCLASLLDYLMYLSEPSIYYIEFTGQSLFQILEKNAWKRARTQKFACIWPPDTRVWGSRHACLGVKFGFNRANDSLPGVSVPVLFQFNDLVAETCRLHILLLFSCVAGNIATSLYGETGVVHSGRPCGYVWHAWVTLKKKQF